MAILSTMRAKVYDFCDLIFSRWIDGYTLKLVLNNSNGQVDSGIYDIVAFRYIGEFKRMPTGAELILAAAHKLNYDASVFKHIQFWELDPTPIKLKDYDPAFIPDLTYEELLVCEVPQVRDLALNGTQSVTAHDLLFGSRSTR